MSLRISTSCAIGLAAALTFGAAGTIRAQNTDTSTYRTNSATTNRDSTRMHHRSTSRRHIRVHKDMGYNNTSSGAYGDTLNNANTNANTGAMTDTTNRTAQTPPTTPDTANRVDTTTATVTTTTTTTATVTPPESTTTTTAQAATMPMAPTFGRGGYLNIGVGASVPTGDFSTNFKSGWNGTVGLGWEGRSQYPLGLRLDLAYDRLSGKSFDTGIGTTFTNPNMELWSAALNVTWRFPFGMSQRTSLYALGGAGAYYFHVPGSTYNDTFKSNTKLGVQGGVGLAFGVSREMDFFVEGRYVHAFQSGTSANFIPVNIGLTFF